jgi:hypothetical protein
MKGETMKTRGRPKGLQKFMVVQNASVSATLFDEHSLSIEGVFDTLEEAEAFVQADAEEHFEPDGYLELDEPLREYCSRMMIFKLVKAVRPVPTLHATWVLEPLREETSDE